MFETLRCPLCKQGHAVLEEEKMGLASLLILKCLSPKCKFEKLFYTFNKVVNSQAFEVNRRVVLATRNIGVDHQGLVKFCERCDEHATTNAGKFISRPSQGIHQYDLW